MAVDIPNYRVVEKLGVGARTRIFRARCMRTGKDYAIKIVKIVDPEDTAFIDLLRTEHVIGTAVDHPVIRKVFELRMLRRRLRVHGAILFMEYIQGISLADKEFKRPLAEVLRIFVDAAEGLHAMHQAGYVHADLKPNNIMLTVDEEVKLIDLGQSAKIHESKPRIQGTIHYIAPEQVHRGPLDQRTDVFGLGATLYRMLMGRPIKTKMNQTINMNAQGLAGTRAQGDGGPLLEELTPCISRLIDDACQLEPEKRIPDMPAMIQRLGLAQTIVQKQDAAQTGAASEGAEAGGIAPMDDALTGVPDQVEEPGDVDP